VVIILTLKNLLCLKILFRIPGGPGSPPTTINHSPPRKLTAKDMNVY
jgi:hypothetical protein